MDLMSQDPVEFAKTVLRQEADGILAAAGRLGSELADAVRLIVSCPGKVVVTGIGKSGLIAQKLAGTFASTGTPAVFLHPVDALHGDLGIYQPGDPTLFLSKSGTASELTRLVPILREFQSSLIGILGNGGSPLAKEMDVVLDASVRREADPHNLAPTASATAAMALGDALAMAVMRKKGFTPDDFARFHPGGQLGRNLSCRVAAAMHQGDQVAWASPDDSLKQIVIAMSRRPLGAAIVQGPDGRLEGLVTDGDVRRAFEAHDDIRELRVRDVMTRSPVRIGPQGTLAEALRLMEDRPSQISVLPVVDVDGACLGLLRLHDVYQPVAG